MAKRYYNTNYGLNEKYDKEASAMLPSGKGNIANMPDKVEYKYWSMSPTFMGETLKDGINSVDAQINLDISRMKVAPKKV